MSCEPFTFRCVPFAFRLRFVSVPFTFRIELGWSAFPAKPGLFAEAWGVSSVVGVPRMCGFVPLTFRLPGFSQRHGEYPPLSVFHACEVS